MHPRVCLLVYLFLAQSAADVQSWDDLAGTIANASKTSQTIVIQLSKRFTMPKLKDFSPLQITNELNVTLLGATTRGTLGALGYQKNELKTPPPFLFELDAGTTLCLRGPDLGTPTFNVYGPVSKLRNGSTLLISDCEVTQSLVVSSTPSSYALNVTNSIVNGGRVGLDTATTAHFEKVFFKGLTINIGPGSNVISTGSTFTNVDITSAKGSTASKFVNCDTSGGSWQLVGSSVAVSGGSFSGTSLELGGASAIVQSTSVSGATVTIRSSLVAVSGGSFSGTSLELGGSSADTATTAHFKNVSFKKTFKKVPFTINIGPGSNIISTGSTFTNVDITSAKGSTASKFVNCDTSGGSWQLVGSSVAVSGGSFSETPLELGGSSAIVQSTKFAGAALTISAANASFADTTFTSTAKKKTTLSLGPATIFTDSMFDDVSVTTVDGSALTQFINTSSSVGIWDLSSSVIIALGCSFSGILLTLSTVNASFTNASFTASAVTVNHVNASARFYLNTGTFSHCNETALYLSKSSSASLLNVSFVANNGAMPTEGPQRGAGAVYIEAGANLTVKDGTFTSNTAPCQGGAIVLAGAGSYASITNGNFTDNTVTAPPTFRREDKCANADNRLAGGAVFVGVDARAIFVAGKFDRNRALPSRPYTAVGGTVFVSSRAHVSFIGSMHQFVPAKQLGPGNNDITREDTDAIATFHCAPDEIG
jgi:predicted outer membrane repeat protein